MPFLKYENQKYDFEDIEQIIRDNKVIEFVGSGDPHEEFGKVKLLLTNIDACEADVILFDGDYLAEPAYIRVEKDPKFVWEDSVGKLKVLFEHLLKCNVKTFCVAGNYEIPGTTADAITALNTNQIEDLGADTTQDPHEIQIYQDETFMDIDTHRRTWPGDVREVKRYYFIGVEGSNPINYTFPGERTEEDLGWALNTAFSKANADPMRIIITTHTPPFGMRDRLGRFGVPQHLWGSQKGSVALRKFVDKYWPFMIVVGHIHEAFGIHIRTRPKDGDTTSAKELIDMEFKSRTKMILAYDSAKTEVSITLNKGTLELWNWSRVRIAEKGTYRLVDIEAEWLDRKGKKKPFKKLGKFFDIDGAFTEFLK